MRLNFQDYIDRVVDELEKIGDEASVVIGYLLTYDEDPIEERWVDGSFYIQLLGNRNHRHYDSLHDVGIYGDKLNQWMYRYVIREVREHGKTGMLNKVVSNKDIPFTGLYFILAQKE